MDDGHARTSSTLLVTLRARVEEYTGADVGRREALIEEDARDGYLIGGTVGGA